MIVQHFRCAKYVICCFHVLYQQQTIGNWHSQPSNRLKVAQPTPCWRQVDKKPPYTHLLSRDFQREVPGELKLVAAALPLSKTGQLVPQWQGRLMALLSSGLYGGLIPSRLAGWQEGCLGQ